MSGVTQKSKRILLFVDHGQVWNVAKVNNGFSPTIIVMNNDNQSVKMLVVEHDCNKEVNGAYELAASMSEQVKIVEHKVRPNKKSESG